MDSNLQATPIHFPSKLCRLI
ncbi:hypothetical protein ID866_10868, partial [Astraeus odoratus]